MGRPRKLDTDDRYNEETLNLHDPEDGARDPDEDAVLELGERDESNSFNRLNDAVLFGDGGY